MKKDDYVPQRTKSINNQSSNTRLENQIALFVSYVLRSPRLIQLQLLPYIQELRRCYEDNLCLKQMVESFVFDEQQRYEPIENSQNLIHNYARILQLRALEPTLIKIADKVSRQRLLPQNKKKQDVLTKRQSIDKIDLLHPEYDTYFKMSRQERIHQLPQHHVKQKFKDFYVEPRFLVRIEEYAHFKSNEQNKGDILFISYQGNIIAGSKVYAVANDKAIQVWHMQSEAYPLPNLNPLPDNPEGDDKKKEQIEDKKDKYAKPMENTSNASFNLAFKFTGHNQKITALSLSTDQYYLLSSSIDRTVRLWDLRLCIPLCTYRGHLRTVWDVAFSPYGYYFLSGSADGFMILWKTDEPHAKRLYEHKNDVYKVNFAKDPAFVISAGQDGTIKIWKTEEAQLHRKITLSKPVINFNIGFSGSLLVAVESSGKITIFDLLKGDTINSFYFYEPQKRKKSKEEAKNKVVRKMMIHDVCLSEDERELSCVAARYVLVYSMDRLQMKVNSNIYSFFEGGVDSEKVTKIVPKEVIYMGIDTNLTFCSYQHKNVLVVAGTVKN